MSTNKLIGESLTTPAQILVFIWGKLPTFGVHKTCIHKMVTTIIVLTLTTLFQIPNDNRPIKQRIL